MTTNDLTHLDCLQMLTKEMLEKDHLVDARLDQLRVENYQLREELETVKEGMLLMLRAARQMQARLESL